MQPETNQQKKLPLTPCRVKQYALTVTAVAWILAAALVGCGQDESSTSPPPQGHAGASGDAGQGGVDGSGGSAGQGATGAGAAGGALGGAGGTGGLGGSGGDAGGTPSNLSQPTRWRSEKYPLNWTPATTDTEGRFIHDFSYAGYRMGEAPIPNTIPGVEVTVTDPPYSADPTGANDATTAIQAAIDYVGQQGGGVVFMPAGTYRLIPLTNEIAALYLRKSGVVLRGAGREQTFLYNDRTDMRQRNVIRVDPEVNARWWYGAAPPVLLTADADNRATSVQLSDASSFQPGDWVIAHAKASIEWVAEHDMTGVWYESIVHGPTFLRQVTAVNGDQLVLDIPLRYPLKVRDEAQVYLAKEHLREIGLEDFSIGMQEHAGTSGWGDYDHADPTNSAYDVHASYAIYIKNLIDGWVRRVNTYRPASNAGPYHLLSIGLRVDHTRNISIVDSIFSHPQYEGGGGNGYGFVISGSDTLLLNCGSVSTRHSYTFTTIVTSGNVLLQSSSAGPRYGTDFHRHLSMANLIDGLTLLEDYVDATFRDSGNHGFSTTQSVIYNTRGLSYHPARDFIVDSRQFDWGFAIGTQGAAPKLITEPVIEQPSNKDTAPEDWSEGQGHSGTIEPQSLYLDQLARRLSGGQAPEYLAEIEKVAPSEDAFTRNGSFAADNYAGFSVLYAKDASSEYQRRSYLKFDLSGLTRPIVKAVLLVHGGIDQATGDSADVRIYGIEDDSWQEDAITWNTQPPLGAYLANQNVDKTAAWRTLDVTPFVLEQMSGDQIVSLAIAQDMEGNGVLVEFASRENSNYSPQLEIIVGPPTTVPIVSATGTVTDPATSAANAIDGDPTTRWANENYGAALTVDLGSQTAVSGMGINFFKGDIRIAFFELRTSTDSVTWSVVKAGQSSGQTEGQQVFLWPTTQTRYLRFVGFGNTESDWNSINELAVCGP